MSTRSEHRTGRSLLGLAVAGAVAVGAPIALAGTAQAAPASDWDRLAQCESGGDWSINTGNGYYGGLQFLPATWRAYGGSGMPHQASKAEQIAVAERTLAGQGWGAWPACSSKLGLRGQPAPSAQAAPAAESTPAPAAESTSASGAGNHTVQPGDTLAKIAAANGTSWQALFERNSDVLSNPDMILVGQTLAV